MLGDPAEQRAGQAGQQAEHGQLQSIQQQGVASGESEATQQGAGIETAGGEAGGREGDGNPGQEDRCQTGQVQVAFGAAQGAADLAVAVAGGLDALVRLQVGFQFALVGGQRLAFAAPEFAVAHPAAGLDDAGGGQVVEVHQYPRCEAVEVADPVRLVGQHAGQAQHLAADLDAVADRQAEGGEQPGFGPGFARTGAGAGFFGLVGLGCAAQRAAQRVAAVGRLDAGEL
ncbi:hypothetical protein BAY1663_00218 [Pseudomonas sp. BAY1663]|nr:hypothetical protein BAY1663_00218 [Pseudomonas sp. BAY1663]